MRAAVCTLWAWAVLQFGTAVHAGLPPFAPGTPPFGKGGSPAKPTPAVLRADEDWREFSKAMGPFASLKAIAVGPTDWTLSLGLDARLGAERYWNENWGQPEGGESAFDIRVNPHASLSMGERVRLFTALKYGDLWDRSGFIPPVERSDPNVHQAFLELAIGDFAGLSAPHDLLLRAGRMELHYGDGNLVSIRNGPNLREDFDGFLMRIRSGRTVVDAFAAYAVEDGFEAFSNGTIDDEGVWGLYSSSSLGSQPGPLQFLDVYYVGYRRQNSRFAHFEGALEETRHSVGVRFGTPPQADRPSWGMEAVWQWGTAVDRVTRRDFTIEAWSLSGRFAAPLPGALPGKPVLGMRWGLTSGEGDSLDERLETFRVPIPRGEYFGNTNPLGPGNLGGFELYLDLRPHERLLLHPYWQPFWRLRSTDGLYSPGSFPLRSPVGSDSFVGHEMGVEVSFAWSAFVQIDFSGGHFVPGKFLRASGPAEPITYVRLQWNLEI